MKKISVVQTCANCRFMGVVLTPPWPEMCNKNYDWQKKIHPARNAWCIDFVPMFQPGKFLYLDYAPLPLADTYIFSSMIIPYSWWPVVAFSGRAKKVRYRFHPIVVGAVKIHYQPWETVYSSVDKKSLVHETVVAINMSQTVRPLHWIGSSWNDNFPSDARVMRIYSENIYTYPAALKSEGKRLQKALHYGTSHNIPVRFSNLFDINLFIR